MFFFVFTPNRGDMRRAAFLGAPVAIIERPQLPAAIVDALSAAQGGSVPGRVVVYAKKVGTETANRVHFLSEYEYSADKIHGGKTRVLAALAKVLAVAQRSSRFGAPPRNPVRRGVFSPAIKSTEVIVRDE